jgi:hypothetical protein
MASTSSPYGLQVISDMVGSVRPLNIPNGIASGYAANIFYGSPVVLNASTGVLQAVTATTDKIYGVFLGCYYTATGGDPRPSPFWASGATYASNELMYAQIIPGWIPGLRFQIQADGAVDQTALGAEFNLSNFTAGSTITGQSAITAAATQVAASSQGQLVLHEFYPGVNSAIGDAYTDLIVSIAYPQAGNGYQTSIG